MKRLTGVVLASIFVLSSCQSDGETTTQVATQAETTTQTETTTQEQTTTMAVSEVAIKNTSYSYERGKKLNIKMVDLYGKDYWDKLKSKYNIERMTANCKTDYDKVVAVTKWVTNLWRHDGDNAPKQSDPLYILNEVVDNKQQFRCVEYGVVIAGCLNALGIPAREIGLKAEDVETRESGAGHVGTEAFLKDLNKWIFIDGQWGAIPILGDTPLNAVEFGEALKPDFAQKDDLRILVLNSGTKKQAYFDWIREYLYYFDFSYISHVDGIDDIKSVMLTPIGAKEPKIFQVNNKIVEDYYTNSAIDFYAQP